MHSNVVSVLNIWFVRIIAFFLILAVSLVVLWQLHIEGVSLVVCFFFLATLAYLAVEILRPGGSCLASGLSITSALPRSIAIGIMLALTSLTTIAATSLAVLSSFDLSSQTSFSMSALIILIVGSFGEEVLFRGTLLEALEQRFGVQMAVGTTSVLFGLAHAFNPGADIAAIANVTLAGVVFAAMVVKARSLWPSIAFHVTWNLGVKVFFGSVSGHGENGWITTLNTTNVPADIVWLVSGTFGIEHGALTTVVLIGCLIASQYWLFPDARVGAARRLRTKHAQHQSHSSL